MNILMNGKMLVIILINMINVYVLDKFKIVLTIWINLILMLLF
jgi:hypothetical protein